MHAPGGTVIQGPERHQSPRTVGKPGDHLPEEFDVTFKDSDAISAGNREAHDPDPLSDADLYLQLKRSLDGTYRVLYGLSPLRVNSLRSKCCLILQFDFN